MDITGSTQTRPAGIFPGQRAMNGDFIPPSHAVSFPSRSGPAEPACVPYERNGPLSEKKT